MKPQPTITVGREAENKKTGLTLAELNQFVQNAINQGIHPRTPITIRAGFKSQILTIQAAERPTKEV